MTGVFRRRGRFGHKDMATEGRSPSEDGGRDGTDATTSQGAPGMAGVPPAWTAVMEHHRPGASADIYVLPFWRLASSR